MDADRDRRARGRRGRRVLARRGRVRPVRGGWAHRVPGPSAPEALHEGDAARAGRCRGVPAGAGAGRRAGRAAAPLDRGTALAVRRGGAAVRESDPGGRVSGGGSAQPAAGQRQERHRLGAHQRRHDAARRGCFHRPVPAGGGGQHARLRVQRVPGLHYRDLVPARRAQDLQMDPVGAAAGVPRRRLPDRPRLQRLVRRVHPRHESSTSPSPSPDARSRSASSASSTASSWRS